MVFPIEGGYMVAPSKKLGPDTLQAGLISTGAGFHFYRFGLLAFGRAGMGPEGTKLGWGGVRGYYSLLGADRFEFGPDLSVSAGAGRDPGSLRRA